MEVIFFILGLVAGVMSVCFGTMDWREAQRGVAGAACGFAVCAGLCFLAAAIIYAADNILILARRRSETQDSSRPGDEG